MIGSVSVFWVLSIPLGDGLFNETLAPGGQSICMHHLQFTTTISVDRDSV